MARKFFKTTITLTILSEQGPVSSGCRLAEVDREMEDGGWCGRIENDGGQEISSAEAARMLIDMDSTPDFFNLDDDGTDLLSGGDGG